MQSHRITNQCGRYGVIVPLSVTFSFEFSDLRGQLANEGDALVFFFRQWARNPLFRRKPAMHNLA